MITRGVRGGGMEMVCVFSDTVRAKDRQTSTMISIILASLRGDRETIQASSAYTISPHGTTYVVLIRFRSHRCRRLRQVHQLSEMPVIIRTMDSSLRYSIIALY